jgi:glycosyltransferase involved in cell wall biosynthesis
MVSDTRELLSRAGVVVVPILSGGGTRFKILESLALAVPVVSTAKGAEGLDVRDGQHLWIRELNQFATAIEQILSYPAAARAIALRGRQVVEKKYSWSAVAVTLREGLQNRGRTLA